MINFFKELEFDNWNSLKEFYGSIDSCWCFRGQANYDWKLLSTMDRLSITVPKLKEYKKEFEQHAIQDFRRNSQLYYGKEYLTQNKFQTISFMQHYGAATRLLDFTESPYVASFFAIDESKDYCSVYAINYMELLSSTRILFATQHDDDSDEINAYKYSGTMSEGDVFDKLVLGTRQFSFVELVQPFYMFDRITQQQGVFLCQGDVRGTFENNLYSNYLVALQQNYQPMYKIKIPNSWRIEMIRDLNRMNINHASLFPGVEGYFKSLKNNFDISVLDRLKHINEEYFK